MSPLPAWLQSVLRLGVISAIALWAVYWGSVSFEARLGRIEASVVHHTQTTEKLQDLLAQHMMLTEIWIAVARQTCLNTARTEEQRYSCNVGAYYPRERER